MTSRTHPGSDSAAARAVTPPGTVGTRRRYDPRRWSGSLNGETGAVEPDAVDGEID